MKGQGPGRPRLSPGEESTLIGVVLPVSELQRVDAAARGMAMTRSEMFRRWLHFLFAEREKSNVEK